MTDTRARSKPWRRRLLTTLTVVGLVGAGAVGGWWWGTRDATASAAAPTTRTQLVAATVSTVKQTVSATGTVEPGRQATVAFSAGGTVTTVPVAIGDTVSAGEVLATLDATALEDAVTLAQASVTAAQDQTDTATTTSGTASAEAQLASARSQLADARSAVEGATLRAPFSGTVAAVGYTVGDTTGSGSSSGSSGSGTGGAGSASSGGNGQAGSGGSSSATTSSGIQVVDTSTWTVQAGVTSADLGVLKKGLQATISPGGATQDVFGTVASVGVVASSTSSGTAEFPVVIAVTGKPTGLHAGTTAEVAITVKQLADVLTVPTQAVHSDNGQTTVEVSTAGSVSSVPVTIGGVYGAQTVVTKGLTEGDQVVVTVRSFPGTGGSTGTGRTGRGLGGGFGGGGGLGGGGFGGGQVPAGGAP